MIGIFQEQLVAEYQNCDIVCFPSIYEGLGAITIEAQAVGRAVISTNKEPMRSVAGGAAILVNNPKDAEELRSAILSLISNDSLRNDIVAKGLKNVENYKVASCAQQYINIYKKL